MLFIVFMVVMRLASYLIETASSSCQEVWIVDNKTKFGSPGLAFVGISTELARKQAMAQQTTSTVRCSETIPTKFSSNITQIRV